ncbi:MAG: cytochrome-c peroxidase [Oleiphilus sp.]
MKNKKNVVLILFCFIAFNVSSHDTEFKDITFEAGHASLQEWLLPDTPPYPEDNKPNEARVELGKTLFFDPRIGGDGNMSCATCHNPLLGWSDALPTAKGFKSQVLGRASPVVTNTAYNTLQMWDGRKKSLEDQAISPMEASIEMQTNFTQLLNLLNHTESYKAAFDKAYPGEGVNKKTVAKAIASFERTIISNNSPFDQWVKGDENALTEQEVEGFKLFVNPEKGNCSVCHSAPNFTDNGFHNIGLASWGEENPDVGRYAERPLGIMKGAFKTPTLRDISLSAPYFHDGSSKTLDSVMEHYIAGGIVKTNLSPNMKALKLNASERDAIVAFLTKLTTPQTNFELPILPID